MGRSAPSTSCTIVIVNLEQLVTLAPTAFSSLTYAAMMGACAFEVRRKRRDAKAMPSVAPRVTIFKPLAGADDDLEENLASFLALDYPAYEILLGVASAQDGAFPVARRFALAHKGLVKLVLTDRDNAVNPKVAQLIDLDRHATGEIVVVSDSNVRVARDYLWSLVRELEQPGVGLATSVFVGSGEQTIGAALENLQLCAVSAPGIVATNAVTPWPITIGKSMAMRRRDLARLGGFARFGDLLAEDQTMGLAFVRAGMGVGTSLEVVHNRNSSCGVRRTLERHTRWAKLRRSLHPLGFAFEPLLSPLTIAILVALVAQTRFALGAVAVVAALQTLVALATVRMLRGHAMAWRHAPLEVVRTVLLFGCWLAACASMRIQWRGHPFLLTRGSVIVPAPPSVWRVLRDRLAGA
jgi:ceramide glucosyltransferase